MPPLKLAPRISFKFRLSTTIVAPFIIQIVVAVGLVGYLSYRNGEKSVNRLASQVRIEVASRTHQVLESYFKTPPQIIKNNINALRLNHINLENKESVERYFASQLQIYPLLASMFVGTPDGTIIYVGRELDGSLVSSTTEIFPQRAFHQLDNEGNHTQFLKFDKFDPRVRGWYKKALAQKEQTWTVYQSSVTSKLVIAPVEPYYDRDGNLVAIFSNPIMLQGIANFLKSLKISATGQVFVMEQNGSLIATSTGDNAVTSSGENGDMQQIKATQSQNPQIAMSAQYLLEKFGDFKQFQGLHEFEFDMSGKKQYLLVQPYSDGKGLDFLVVVVVPESDFMEQINQNSRHTIIFSMMALVLTILVGILTSRLITFPIFRACQAANQLAMGDRVQQVPSSPIAEISELSNAFNKMSGQLKEAFETLEDKVKERTADLAIANQEINTLNQNLKADNLRLGAELDVVRRMQMMILPNAEELEIEGLDIAAYMEAADDVGGDYYEVLNLDGMVTLGIGDVTGHGLESGILMLMTQTSVRTLNESGEHDPLKFLDVLNRTLYKNVKRINSEKCLTLSILNYINGKVTISGQHEETIVVRKNGAIERIDTIDLGFPIALDRDITPFVHQIIVELERGDGLVLYTDGIPEACDIAQKLYGIEKMCDVISQSWDLSAEEIKTAIIDDVRRHIGEQKVFDDITLLVLKRN